MIKLIKFATSIAFFFLCTSSFANSDSKEKKQETTNITGIVLSNNLPLAYANVLVKNTVIGTLTNENGEFVLKSVPIGNITILTQLLGYKPQELNLNIKNNTTALKINLEEDVLGIDQIVVTADRSAKKRSEASTIVNQMNSKALETVNAYALSDGLSYIPGLRTEVNCQNCGMVQVRMNGLPGDYSQILINNRPIFSGLVGVYGLELYPVSMIDNIEVIRGGGSALYGSNAVAGTINIITKNPLNNSYAAKIQTGAIGIVPNADAANEYAANFNTTVISKDKNTGLALFGSSRNRDGFDANGDSFSELMKLQNLSFGTRLFHKINYRSKISFDFFRISEKRRGGNKFDYLYHESDLTEATEHEITTGAATYEYFIGTNSELSVFASAQNAIRDSYYGADQSLSDYGNTKGFTYNIGSQFQSQFGANSLITGIEITGDKLKDQKLGYPDYSSPIYNEDGEIATFEQINNSLVAHQNKIIYGAFAQFERTLGIVKLSAGLRLDRYDIEDKVSSSGNTKGTVLSPRITTLLNITQKLQGRFSYSQGYRAPQIFDEDLHISASGSRQVIHKNATDLKEETSHSLMASVDYNGTLFSLPFSILGEGFYTYLQDAFSSTPGDVDDDGVVIYYKENAKDGAQVYGLNIESTALFRKNIEWSLGFTIQRSEFKEPQELNEKCFLRTPNTYGYTTADWDINKHWCISATAQYTGPMKIAYYDQSIVDPNYEGELRTTIDFIDVGLKASYLFKIKDLPLEIFGGMKNIFNNYQSDFETGVDRDPTYIYGPAAPRTIYCGLSIKDIL